ncbi:tyrosine--tRNA ligase [Pseudobacteriovorax antillogorgiicola]|uniref:Tyrosine--tRNA ligase n=1 Tax=Pseudobacteriovorax antillogorgiicola TaxID=1513793 RepID=A0A1Y6B8Q4_9BACT|nr:tyrosine--tRNA ligase [Pseudobacteriovorax antillogorgiicola]TCS58816.1 tyrosyl-tRNA synthetase [Pseudobacteriovorax antillogorgiicola]SME94348.1 tyrosyl-tRNA synthetase [Pseudobacteriovorax antillogorgiicola]
MGFVEVMKERGMLAQVTHEEELVSHLAEEPRTAYVGFDPTADSLHVGHLLPVLALRRWQQAGHRVIALVGGGTALVGDPTGKTEMRKMTSAEEIDERIKNFKVQLGRFLDLNDPKKGLILNNADWLRPLEYLPFLREIGSQFSVNRMLTAECFKQRLEKGLSFLEFNYMILQSYDFYHLNKEFDCSVQLGGDDQWSNMLGGMDLVRRKSQRQAYCLTVPLLVNSQGKKMGKTESGAVWIDADKTSPYDLFQYFRNIEDDMVEKCLMYFSDLPVEQVKGLAALEGQKINEAKVTLAFEATKLIHGVDEAEKAKAMAQKLFEEGAGQPDAPEVIISESDVSDEMGLLDFLMLSKIFPSKAEVRRLVQQGGISVDGEKLTDPKGTIRKDQFVKPDGVLLKKGKKHYFNIKVQ